MLGLLAVALLTSAPPPEVVVPAQPSRVSLYGYPLATARAALAPGLGGPRAHAVLLPLGATFSRAPHWGISLELSLAYAPGESCRSCTVGLAVPGWAVGLAAGPSWFSGAQGAQGFFVSPRLALQVAKQPSSAVALQAGFKGPIDLGRNISRAFLIGVEVGYQRSFGRLAVGAGAGASFGYLYDLAAGQQTLLLTQLIRGVPTSDGRPQGWGWSLNVNLVRLGYAF